MTNSSLLDLPSVGVFIGRHAEYENLNSLVSENRIVVIEGLSGVGKTFLVSYYAHNKIPDFGATIWHTFQEEENIKFVVEDVAEQFKKQGQEFLSNATAGEKQHNAASTVKALIEQIKRVKSLLIFDAFEELLDDNHKIKTEHEELINELFKASFNSKIIFTTKIRPQLNPSLLSQYCTFELKGLSTADTADLLSQLSKKHHTELDLNYSQQIYKVTEGHPMALNFLIASLIHGNILQSLLNDLQNVVASEVAPHLLRSLYPKLSSDAQKQLRIVSAFRKPFVFAEIKFLPIKTDFSELRSYFFVEADLGAKLYSLHPIVREYAYKKLRDDKSEFSQIHKIIGDFYFSQVKASKDYKNSKFISALLEANFHYNKSNYPQGQDSVGYFIAKNLKQTLRELAKLGESNLVKRFYESALKTVTDDSELHQFYARLLEEHYPNNFKEISNHYAEATRLTPGNAERQMDYLVFLAKAGNYELAETVFERAALIPSCRTSDKVYVPYAKILLEARKNSEAEKVLKKALQNVEKDSLSQVYVMLGTTLAYQRKFEQAEESFDDGVKTVPVKNGLEDVYLAFIKFLGMRRKPDKAIVIVKDAMTKLPPQKLARLYVEYSKVLRLQGKLQEASKILEEGINKVPSKFNLYSLYWEYCDLLKSQKDFMGALNILKRGINHVLPEHKGDALILEYNKLSKKTGNFQEAERALKFGIKNTPVGEGLKILYLDYSNLLVYQGRYDEALTLLDEALHRLPKRTHSVIKRKKKDTLEEKNSRKDRKGITHLKRNAEKTRKTIFIQNKPVEMEEMHDCEFKEVKGNNPLGSISSMVDEYVVAWLNSMKSGGKIYWGIRNEDRIVVGVNVDYRTRDEIRRVVTDKLHQINPKVPPSSYSVEFYQVLDTQSVPVHDLYVLEVSVPHPSSDSMLYATGKGEVFIKTDSGKKKLDGIEIQAETIKRQSLRRNPQ